jgi:hypothetical protein
MNQRRLWLSSPRPNHLVNALAAAAALREKFSGCCFIYEQSAWWDNARWEQFLRLFEKVVVLNRVPTCRGLRDLRRLENDLRARQDQLRNMGVAPEDVLICISGATGVSNAIASAYPHNLKILLNTRKAFEDASRPVNFLRYRFTTSSALEYFYLQPRLGLLRALHLKPWMPVGGDGARLERPERDLQDIYQAVVLWSNRGTSALPPAGASKKPGAAPIFASPYPNLQDFAHSLPGFGKDADSAAHKRRVVFFGTPFLLVRNLPPDQYADQLNRCLDYLRAHYGGRCRLIYRPHPAETAEQDHLRLAGFDFENDREVAELYFVKNFAAIEAVYSVSSTVSRVALNYGLNAYALWPCFPFNATAREYYRTLMDTVPPEFEIQSLEKAPVAYNRADTAPGGTRFSDVLSAALDHAWRSHPHPSR